jgi:hypothetical protein
VCIAALGALSACTAVVNDFSATPRHICAGERVTLHWSVTGSATLEAAPPVPGFTNGPVDHEGTTTLSPSATTTVGLHVTRFLGSPTTSRQVIVVEPANAKPEALAASIGDPAASPGCKDGKLWATVHAKRFAQSVATVSAHPGDALTYEVRHLDRSGTIGPGATSSAFAGTPIDGDWLLIATLDPSVPCDSPNLPNNLVVDVVAQCDAGGAK